MKRPVASLKRLAAVQLKMLVVALLKSHVAGQPMTPVVA